MGRLPFLASSAVANGRVSVEDVRSGGVRYAYPGDERARQG
jgi:hypothetical protein